jgi:F0F1-type ATP synthase assembly protein I
VVRALEKFFTSAYITRLIAGAWSGSVMTERRKPEREELSVLATVAPFMGYGVTLAMATALFFFVGWRVDRWLGSTPIFSIVGALTGAAGGFYYIVRQVGSMGTGSTRRGGGDEPGRKVE